MINRLFFFGFLVLSITACNLHDDTCSKHPIRISTHIEGTVETRASNISWDANDKIGIFMFQAGAALATTSIVGSAANIAYVTNGNGAFSPDAATIYFPQNGAAVDFISYYPLQAGIVGFLYQINLSAQNPLKNIDLLYSSNARNLNVNTSNVHMVFAHQLSKITISISPGTGLTAADLTGLQISISNMPSTANFNLVDGQISNIGAAGNLSPVVTADGLAAEAIVIPGTGSGRVITFTLQDGRAFSYTIPDTYNYPASMETKYFVSIQETSLILTGSINPWGAANGSGENIIAE